MLPQLEAVQEARKQQQLLGANGIAATIVLPMTSTSTASNTPKLAPKAMELSASKRGALKRFSNSPNLFKAAVAARPATPDVLAPLDTQENLFGESESESQQSELLSSKTGADTVAGGDQQRTPLNSVNPFAMKRKLVDTGVIFGSEKLKLAKK